MAYHEVGISCSDGLKHLEDVVQVEELLILVAITDPHRDLHVIAVLPVEGGHLHIPAPQTHCFGLGLILSYKAIQGPHKLTNARLGEYTSYQKDFLLGCCHHLVNSGDTCVTLQGIGV